MNQELDDYEKEARASEQEVNILKQSNENLLLIRDQLIQELENIKNNNNIKEDINIENENKDDINIKEKKIEDKNINELFTNKLNNFVNRILFKNKIRLFTSMLVTPKIEHLVIENAKLNNEKIDLNQKVEILSYLLNNPEEIVKYMDENGNLVIPDNDNIEGINVENDNINNMEGEDINNIQNNEDENP